LSKRKNCDDFKTNADSGEDSPVKIDKKTLQEKNEMLKQPKEEKTSFGKNYRDGRIQEKKPRSQEGVGPGGEGPILKKEEKRPPNEKGQRELSGATSGNETVEWNLVSTRREEKRPINLKKDFTPGSKRNSVAQEGKSSVRSNEGEKCFLKVTGVRIKGKANMKEGVNEKRPEGATEKKQRAIAQWDQPGGEMKAKTQKEETKPVHG